MNVAMMNASTDHEYFFRALKAHRMAKRDLPKFKLDFKIPLLLSFSRYLYAARLSAKTLRDDIIPGPFPSPFFPL